MTNLIKQWAELISESTEKLNEYENVWMDDGPQGPGYYDDEGNYIGKTSKWNYDHKRSGYGGSMDRWYGRGSSSSRYPSHVDWSRDGLTPTKRALKNLKSKFPNRYVVVNDGESKGLYLGIIKHDDTPSCYFWTEMASSTIPFKTEESAEKFIRMFADLPKDGDVKREYTLGTEKYKIVGLSQLHEGEENEDPNRENTEDSDEV